MPPPVGEPTQYTDHVVGSFEHVERLRQLAAIGEAKIAILRPGDRVLITISRDLTYDALDEMLDQLRQRFPGVEFTFIDGATGLAVMPTEPDAEQAGYGDEDPCSEPLRYPRCGADQLCPGHDVNGVGIRPDDEPQLEPGPVGRLTAAAKAWREDVRGAELGPHVVQSVLDLITAVDALNNAEN